MSNNNNERYIFALDMDGTLLDDNKQISSQTKQFLSSLEKDGHVVILASGRPFRALKVFYDDIGLHSPLICYNGAYCTHPYDKNFEETHFTFPKEIIKEIYKEVKPYVKNVMCETNDNIWLEKEDEELAKFFWHGNLKVTYGDIFQTLSDDPWTMLMQGKDKKYDDKILEATHKHKGFEVRFWYNSEYSEIYYLKTSKAKCLEQIAKYYNIPHKNIVAIGDADNDIEMVSLSGYGIAMKNANDSLKKVAKYISEYDNNHDGVIHAIKHVLNLE